MKPIIVAHTRCGTHFLAKLLHDNFECGTSDYEELHYSHSRIPDPGVPYIHLFRPIFPVMLSIWRVREHLGIAESVRFSDMIRTSWEEMPRSEKGPAQFNGKYDDKVCAPRDFKGLLVDRWLMSTQLFAKSARLNISYQYATQRPWHVMEEVQRHFLLDRKKAPFKYPFSEVGWQPVSRRDPVVTDADMQFLDYYQEELSWLFG